MLKKLKLRRPLLVFLLLSFVSLFADMTYEGGRSISGPYLELLGGTALVAGGVSLGDFLGYLVRGVSGSLLSRYRSSLFYWSLVFIGYFINLIAIPLLAVAGYWDTAFILLVLERIGKGLRAPARDIVLGEVAEGIGVGKVYGIHEVLDQIGAVAGPLLVAWAATIHGIRWGFLVTAIPAGIALILLLGAYLLYPSIKEAEAEAKPFWATGAPRGTIMLASAIGLSFILAPHWILGSYYYSVWGASIASIGALYSMAMLVDAFSAIVFGALFDRYPFQSLTILVIGAFAAGLLFLYIPQSPLPYVLAWGIFMGLYESIGRAGIAKYTSIGSRAQGFAVLGFASGIGMLISGLQWSILYGVLGHSLLTLQVVELLGLLLLLYKALK